jgi:phosphohistidine phosphatase
MDLILWRHADAEDAPPGKPDAGRELTAKGEKQAKRMAAWIRKRLKKEATVMASPAQRAQQTARALTRSVVTRPEVGTGADARSVLRAAGWPEGDGVVVVVGHQPTLGQAAALAVTGKIADWSIRKGAVWWLECRDGEEVIVRAVLSPDLV